MAKNLVGRTPDQSITHCWGQRSCRVFYSNFVQNQVTAPFNNRLAWYVSKDRSGVSILLFLFLFCFWFVFVFCFCFCFLFLFLFCFVLFCLFVFFFFSNSNDTSEIRDGDDANRWDKIFQTQTGKKKIVLNVHNYFLNRFDK